MKALISSNKLVRNLNLFIGLIFIALPFHAILTTWLGSNINHLDLLRVWKEILIVLMIPPVLLLVRRSSVLKNWVRRDAIVRLFIAYLVVHLVFGFWALDRHEVNAVALIYALIINLRFIGFFLICYVVATYSDQLKKYALRLVLWPAGAVLAFGLVQKFLLPYDFLKHLGYGPKTIPAYQTVDSSLDYRRLQSTLRGANPLGAYLILTTVASVVIHKTRSVLKPLFILVSIIILFYTYSRSAWIGLALSLGFLAFVGTKRLKLQISYIALGLVILLAGGLYFIRSSQSLQDTFFHTSTNSKVPTTSNSVHLRSMKAGLHDVWYQPLGRGPGTAGPASVRNNHPSRIAENYYLQLGQEVGIEGLMIFLGINYLVMVQLWSKRSDSLAKVLFASWIGISFVNLVSHAWTDDTLSLLWWGLAGVALAPVIIESKAARNNETKNIQK